MNVLPLTPIKIARNQAASNKTLNSNVNILHTIPARLDSEEKIVRLEFPFADGSVVLHQFLPEFALAAGLEYTARQRTAFLDRPRQPRRLGLGEKVKRIWVWGAILMPSLLRSINEHVTL